MPELPRRAGRLRPGLLCLCCAVLVGCGGNARAPVEDRNARPAPAPRVQALQSQRSYRVQPGDTLYSIAFRYGFDYRRVAAANGIPAPYTIYVGQQLVLHEGALPAAPAAPGKPAAPARAAKPATQSPPSSAPKSAPKSAPRAAPPAASAATAPPAAVYTGQKVTAWRWPTSGKVMRRYSGSVHKGIDIGGKRGDPVVAVAAGKVVYAGTGIVGLGELVIVKHNEEYLSAYAHNDALLVSEGQVVRAGESIARKGSSGTDSVKLHFEIRREGKPIDPLRLLPRR